MSSWVLRSTAALSLSDSAEPWRIVSLHTRAPVSREQQRAVGGMVTWLWALVLPLTAYAQSGGGDGEPNVHCSSHLSLKTQIRNILTCQLDPDDAEDVVNITLCHSEKTCRTRTDDLVGNSFTFKDLDDLKTYDLTIHFTGGETFKKQYMLRQIIRPSPPWIVNAVYLQREGRAQIQIGTSYQGDYLDGHLRFQLNITDDNNDKKIQTVMLTNVTIEGSYLKMNTNYHVQVRAEPHGYFTGSWSEWSPSVSFSTWAVKEPDATLLIYTLIAAVLILLLISAIVTLRWYKVIKSSIWPSIPNPKNTLLQMYKPNKGWPISFNPEVFRDGIIHRVDRMEDKTIAPEFLGAQSTCERRGWSPKQEDSSTTLWSLVNSHEECSLIPVSNQREGAQGVLGTQTSGLLNGSESFHGSSDSGPKGLAISQTGRREEPYITMSSFFKTQ
ncbi:hypothetical protein AGOR_G00244310 [Albula goreensis]|uniref:Fibronectin type-III domain-containing protein n=1 Tax=Albula goreensis TaxID=1534307 RepID=A0A8T3CDM1_9TELE|nr:hypothetical protein AGOR_G00244310 [Albula goreensis]